MDCFKNSLKTIDIFLNREKQYIFHLTTKENKELAILLFCETANISASECFCDQWVHKLSLKLTVADIYPHVFSTVQHTTLPCQNHMKLYWSATFPILDVIKMHTLGKGR